MSADPMLQTLAVAARRQVAHTLSRTSATTGGLGVARFSPATATRFTAKETEDYKNGYKVGSAKGVAANRAHQQLTSEDWIWATSPAWQQGWKDGVLSTGATLVMCGKPWGVGGVTTTLCVQPAFLASTTPVPTMRF